MHICDNDQLESEFFINPQGSYVPLVVMTSVRQQRSVCDLASFCGSRHSSSILATQRRKASSDSGLTKLGWRGNGRATSSGLDTHTHTRHRFRDKETNTNRRSCSEVLFCHSLDVRLYYVS